MFGRRCVIGIGELDAYARRAGLHVQIRIDGPNVASEESVRVRATRTRHLAVAARSQVALGDIGHDPDDGQIGEAEQGVAGLNPHALNDIRLQDVTVTRRGPGDGQRADRFAGVLDDLRSAANRTAEIPETLPGASMLAGGRRAAAHQPRTERYRAAAAQRAEL